MTEDNGFAALGARPETVEALAAVGITQPFPIQKMTLQIAMGKHDLIGQARTGTGKTLGFGVPMLQNVKSKEEGSNGVPQGLVVAPGGVQRPRRPAAHIPDRCGYRAGPGRS